MLNKKEFHSHLYSARSLHNRQLRWRRSLVGILILIISISLVLAVVAYKYYRPSYGASTPGSAASSIAPGKGYGIAAGSSLTSLSNAALDQRMKLISSTGAKWIRYDFDWSLIQPDNARSYNWSRYDAIVAESKKYNLSVLGIIDFTPAWARLAACSGSAKCRPSNPQAFASFASILAKRYKSQGVHDWEIWNEPNSKDFWQPTPSPQDYSLLLKDTSIALKQADPKAFVITGGLSPQPTNGITYSPIDFLSAVYAQGVKDYFDAVGDHPYTFPLSPKSHADDAWSQMASPQSSLRKIMVKNGDQQKKIWITEFGAPTGGPGPVSTISNPQLNNYPYVVDEDLQAKILGDALSLYSSYGWVGPFFVYSIQDAGTDQSTNENFFGLVRADGSHKPAFNVFQRIASKVQ